MLLKSNIFIHPFLPIKTLIAKHEVNIHSLRKTYAYILKRNGIHVTTAQKLMGHASPMVTMRIYTAVLSEEIVEAGEILKDKLKLDF